MIDWIWVVVAAFGGAFVGVLAVGLAAGSGKSTLEEDNMMLRERLRKYEGKKSK